jgi:hypothetical protein
MSNSGAPPVSIGARTNCKRHRRKHERKNLRALAYVAENGSQSVPSRLTGGATGYAAPTKARTDDTTPVEDITIGFEEP